MQLEGSCHCGGVRFSLNAPHAYPFNLCYRSICRKTAGGGYAVNLGGETASLKVEGEENLSVYQAALGDGAKSPANRHFCRLCGSALWPLGSALAGAYPSLCFGRGHRIAGSARAYASNGCFESALGAGPGRAERPDFRALPQRID